MKRITLSFLFCLYLTLSFAQAGSFDSSFGSNGIVKTSIGATLNYKSTGTEVLVQPNGSMFFIFKANGALAIAKKHANGTIDSTYGTYGYATPPTSIVVNHAALQADGKIVVVGSISAPQADVAFAVARINTDGSLDTSFNGSGVSEVYFGEPGGGATAVAIQADGKIIVAGNYVSNFTLYTAVLRYNTDGQLDNGFGNSGIPGIQNFYFGFNDNIYAVALQSDGKIVLGGAAIIRYKSNGVPDSSFGGTGRIGFNGIANAMLIQPDNKIVLAGNNYAGSNPGNDFTIFRYKTDGTPDSSFANNGIGTTDFGGSTQTPTSVVIQSDGKLIIAGYATVGTNINFAVVRYNSNGSADNSFSGDGQQLSSLNLTNTYIKSIALQQDGKLLAFGHTTNVDSPYIVAARYNTNGTFDNTFDGDGVLTDHLSRNSTFYTCTAVQTDGKLVTAGYAWNGSNYDFAIARYNMNGSLDNSFSLDGKQTTDFGSTNDRIRAIAIQTDGKIVVAGASGDNFGLARYNSDGSADVSFDSDGMLTTDFGGADSANAVVIQADGKIVAGGTNLVRYNTNGAIDPGFQGPVSLGQGTGNNFVFACSGLALQTDGKIALTGGATTLLVSRCNTNGATDTTFGHNGLFYEFDHAGKSVAIQPDGKILIAGYREVVLRNSRTSEFALLRLNTDGTMDNTFNSGSIDYAGSGLAYASSVKIQSDNKIIVGGDSYGNFMLVRYNPNGQPDNDFGIGGVLVTSLSPLTDVITGMAVCEDKLYAVGYGLFDGTLGVAARYQLGPVQTVYVSAANGNWNDPGTWVNGAVPPATAQVVVHNTVTVTANTTCYSLKVEQPAGVIIIASGNNLTITH